MYTTLAKYNTGNIEKFLNDIDKYSIGMDEWFHRFNSLHQTESNYPPYNVVKESSTATRVEIALAGFKKKKYLFIQKTISYLWRVKKTPQKMVNICIRDLEKGHSPEYGRFLMM